MRDRERAEPVDSELGEPVGGIPVRRARVDQDRGRVAGLEEDRVALADVQDPDPEPRVARAGRVGAGPGQCHDDRGCRGDRDGDADRFVRGLRRASSPSDAAALHSTGDLRRARRSRARSPSDPRLGDLELGPLGPERVGHPSDECRAETAQRRSAARPVRPGSVRARRRACPATSRARSRAGRRGWPGSR